MREARGRVRLASMRPPGITGGICACAAMIVAACEITASMRPPGITGGIPLPAYATVVHGGVLPRASMRPPGITGGITVTIECSGATMRPLQ